MFALVGAVARVIFLPASFLCSMRDRRFGGLWRMVWLKLGIHDGEMAGASAR